jgi:hypothetical protein
MRLAHADRRSPPPSPRGHPLSSVRPPAWERAPLQTLRTDRGSCCSAYPRRSASSHEPGCLPPLRTWARLDDCSSTLPASASRSRRPHVVPMAGGNVLIGPCKRAACAIEEVGTSPTFRHSTDTCSACRSLRCDFERAGSPFQPRLGDVTVTSVLTLASPRLGLTTQARQRGSVRVAGGDS